ncbi:MAG: sel1 repeat family protein [Candidatus Cloacimonetes bacterium]|nr:sel1 repeat family protein [Candidatus Cloacimonadota bacterium]
MRTITVLIFSLIILSSGFALDFKALKEQAGQGNPDAQVQLGKIYESIGVDAKYRTAASWYRKAAEQNHAEAQFRLGMLYEEGKGFPRDYMRSFQYIRDAATNGFSEAQYRLGTKYYLGKGLTRNVDKALEWLTKAAEQEHAYAIETLRTIK